MKEILLVLSMIFFHIIDDYHLQGLLGSLKQKKWWDKNYPDKKYRYDYIAALLTHAFSWSFMVHIPIVIYLFIDEKMETTGLPITFTLLFLINMIIHARIDHKKANELKLNLTEDQLLHMIQIFITAAIYICN